MLELVIPAQMAVNFKPGFKWGEIAWDISGMFSPFDYVEFNKRMILEHDMRGYTREDMIGNEGITDREMRWCKMPLDRRICTKSVKRYLFRKFF